MSCTVYYQGKLKKEKCLNDVFNIIKNHTKNLNIDLKQLSNSIIINFLEGKTETLIFDFCENKINGTWKWGGDNPEEFYRILDMFIDIKSLFKTLYIDDEDGLCTQYIYQKKPCKIVLRQLSPVEVDLLNRIKVNLDNSPSELENFIIKKSDLNPYNKSLLRLVIQDFIDIMGYKDISDFNPNEIIEFFKLTSFFGEILYDIDIKKYDFERKQNDLSRVYTEIWLSCKFNFKGNDITKLPKTTRGLATSIEAAVYGMESMFFNCHTGGATNSKEAEMMKFAKKYFRENSVGGVVIYDEPERELQFLFSMMDYLGLKYKGI